MHAAVELGTRGVGYGIALGALSAESDVSIACSSKEGDRQRDSETGLPLLI